MTTNSTLNAAALKLITAGTGRSNVLVLCRKMWYPPISSSREKEEVGLI